VAGHLDDADAAVDDLELLTGRSPTLLPAWEMDLSADHGDDEIAGQRLNVCNRLLRGESPSSSGGGLYVAPLMALLQPVPTPETLAGSRLSVARGQEIDPEDLLQWLVDAGFESVEQVDQQGEFARRGGIVDVFPAGASQAVRIEFFGDQVESLRQVDLDTQRSTDEIDEVDFTAVAVGRETAVGRTTRFLDYLPESALVALSEPADLRELADTLSERMVDLAPAGEREGLISPEALFAGFEARLHCRMTAFRPPRTEGAARADLGIRQLTRLSLKTAEALTELQELAEADNEVWVYCETPAERERFLEVIGRSHPSLAGRVRTAIGHLHSAFHWPARQLVAVGHHELYHRYAKLRRVRRVRAGRPIESLLDLNAGDYVVHVAHGIARFDGLRVMEKDGRKEEYLRLRFADNAVLAVPVSRIDLVQKYIGSKGKKPTLSKLGGKTWSRQKQRVAEAVEDLAADMLRVQAMRSAMEGTSYPRDTDWQRRFADEFVYTETPDQLAAIEQMDHDLASKRPMDRLLCGDVGYGKTELAMRAAFKVAESGRQVAVLVPTTVLAEQHHRTFRERLADYPFEVDSLSRFRTAKEQKEIAQRVSTGGLDVLIGTHRILSQDVRFADLGLVIIDEEQRFGVAHKERLKTLRETVDVLTMTATPIPRTLHMSLLGLRDISALATPPMDRRAIHTEVTQFDDGLVRAAIQRELARDGQAFLVHNRVHDIESFADRIQQLVPDAKVGICHGQMPGKEVEKIMLQFVRKMIDVLVCTTIIESGLDIPSANTMIIHEADRYGLSELHQLRGRVGRYKHRAYCYLLLPEGRPLSHVAAKRLKAIEEFSDLGAGFQIAMRDLEIRGAGNILGTEQSGHIAVVGYELYCQLLERAVRQLKGEPVPVTVDTVVELGIDAYIPADYIAAERQRMEIYRRVVACHDTQSLAQLRGDLADAYGQPPEQVEILLDLAEIRVLAGMLGIKSIVRTDPDLIFAVRDFARAEGVFKDAPGSVRLPDNETVHWRPPPVFFQMPTLLTVLVKRLREAAGA
jgi:transcription-repair coupling factor (superfamily II helicase)